ncbi:MAG TPA: homoserine dehydrogenase [Clostridia bacterium]|nr:homoserine dehydrogenase [Clostridia bacterium]
MVKIGLLGLGTVGTGVREILSEKKSAIEEQTGKTVEISKILVNNLEKDRNPIVDSKILTDNPSDILDDPDIDIVVELIGGIEPAHTYITRALENGKHVVTANKAVLSHDFLGLTDLAKKNDRGILFEASVAGGIPIIKPLKELIKFNKINEIKGILNGTTNFILSKMIEGGLDFKEALVLAQEVGFAEADPTDDIEGYDAARKISILSSIAFGYNVTFEDVDCRGISSISAFDIDFFKKLGLAIKLVGSAYSNDLDFDASVEPVLLNINSIMANVNDAFNIVSIEGDIVGNLQFYGQGAGKNPTGNAVVSDIIDIINGELNPINIEKRKKPTNTPRILSNYYLRIFLKSQKESDFILKTINKYKLKYKLVKGEESLVLILQNISRQEINNLIENLEIKGRSCYARINSEGFCFIQELNLESFSELVV